MSLVKVPMKVGGGAKRNGSVEQGTQVSTAIQRAATTTRYRHTEKLSGDTYQAVYLRRHAKREGRGGANCRTNAQFGAQNCTTSQSEYTSSKALIVKTCMSNWGAWSANATDQHWLDFNLA